MSQERPEALFRGMTTFITRELPPLNDLAESSGVVEPLITASERWILDVKNAVADGGLTRRKALRLLQLLSFVVSSVERHLQTNGSAPGEGVERLAIGPTLIRLGEIAHHVPRDGHMTYWLDNRARLTFTGARPEVLFIDNVNLTQDLCAVSASALCPVCDGDVPLTSPAAIEAIRFVTANVGRIHEAYRVFMEQNETTNQWHMTPEFFMRMRQYLLPYVVGGRTWSGPNAANIVAQPELDYHIGTVLPFYDDIVKERFALWSDEEREIASRAMGRPSLIKHLLLGLTVDESASVEEIAAAVEGDLSTFDIVDAVADLIGAWGRFSAYHFALIMNFLVKPRFPPELQNAVVPPTRGTGSHGHEATRRIMEMRAKHPIGTKIIAAVRMVKTRLRAVHQ